jgi:hypothetical protein
VGGDPSVTVVQPADWGLMDDHATSVAFGTVCPPDEHSLGIGDAVTDKTLLDAGAGTGRMRMVVPVSRPSPTTAAATAGTDLQTKQSVSQLTVHHVAVDHRQRHVDVAYLVGMLPR